MIVYQQFCPLTHSRGSPQRGEPFRKTMPQHQQSLHITAPISFNTSQVNCIAPFLRNNIDFAGKMLYNCTKLEKINSKGAKYESFTFARR